MRPVWIQLWTWWGIVGAVWISVFLFFEGWALTRPAIGDTLSESVWFLRDTGSWLYWLIIDLIYVTAAVMAWLLFHFRFQSGRAG